MVIRGLENVENVNVLFTVQTSEVYDCFFLICYAILSRVTDLFEVGEVW